MRARIARASYPPCETCGTTVKGRDNRFCSPACIPKSMRQAAGSKGRKAYAYRRRALTLRPFLDRLSGRVTRDELIDVLTAYGKVCYHNGWRAGQAGSSMERARERGAA